MRLGCAGVRRYLAAAVFARRARRGTFLADGDAQALDPPRIGIEHFDLQIARARNHLATQQQVVFNNYFDAGIGMVLIVVVGLIVVESLRQWYLLLTNRRSPDLQESPRVPSRLVQQVAGAAE